MNDDNSFRNRYRFTFLAIAFAMITLPAIGLYQSALNGHTGLTMVLMGVVVWVN